MLGPIQSLGAILAGIGIVTFAQGLLGTLVPLRLAATGVDTDVSGLIVTLNAVGFLVGCLAVARPVRWVGHIRAFAAFAAGSAIATLAMALTSDPAAWGVLRFAMGFFSAGLFLVTESWLNEQTPHDRRGLVLTTYVVVAMLFWGVGQLSLTVLPEIGMEAFIVASGAFSAALIPVALTRSRNPTVPEHVSLGLSRLYRLSPTGFVGCVVVGMTAATFQGVAPLWGAAEGLGTSDIARAMAASQIGGLLLQWPLGILSDRVGRRSVLIVTASATALVSLTLGLASAPSLVMIALLFGLFGGFAEASYPLAVAHANDHADPRDYVSLSGGLLIVWAMGSSVGPVAVTAAMDWAGSDALFAWTGGLAAAYAGFVGWRVTRRPAVVGPGAEHFQMVPTPGSPVAAELDPRVRTSPARMAAAPDEDDQA